MSGHEGQTLPQPTHEAAESHGEPAGQAESLRAVDRLNAELLGTVSHELRSPLATIKGYADTLLRHERRLPRDERHEFLLAISEASDRLSVIIERLLLMSQLETGTVTLKLVPVNAERVAREALNAAAQRAPQSTAARFSFTVRKEDGAGVPSLALPLVRADPRWLREVLDNLLENAIKYSPAGGAVEIWLRPVPPDATLHTSGGSPAKDQAMVEIAVRDEGLGIPTDHLGRVFDRFHRVDTRLTREGEGLGLGLAICQRIVALHGGAIWVESAGGTEGAGSTFHVVLPAMREDLMDAHGDAREVAPEGS